MNQKQSPQDNTINYFFDAVIFIFFKSIKTLFQVLLDLIKKSDNKHINSFLKSAAVTEFFGNLTKSKRITVKDIKPAKENQARLEKLITDKTKVPIGTDLRSENQVFLTIKEINQHVLVAGATGEGKTTLMTTMIRHPMIHGFPIIIIDPKGDFEDVKKIHQMAINNGRGDKFKLFSLAYPEKSCSYNPLKIGTPEQLKSKIMEALGLEHEYYGSVAAQFLANLFDVLTYLEVKKSLTLMDLYKYLSSPNDLGKLDLELKAKPRSPKQIEIMAKMHSLKTTDRKDLLGIMAHINAMCLTEFDEILGNYENTRGEIDIAEALNNNEILYFQMNTPGYADFSMRIGKLILQDLKLITSLIHAAKIQRKYEFGFCFIDEFGSFVTQSFAELLKMIRSTGIGMNLFMQGIADIEAINKPLANQVLGNTKVKIILRQDIDTDVETWSSMAGTEDAEIESYQMNTDGLTSGRTGMGNVHEGKKMKIDFDVFKNLNVGQAVVINKGRHTQELVQIWQQAQPHLKTEISEIQTKPDIFKSYTDLDGSARVVRKQNLGHHNHNPRHSSINKTT